jgi:hypothetical protein
MPLRTERQHEIDENPVRDIGASSARIPRSISLASGFDSSTIGNMLRTRRRI